MNLPRDNAAALGALLNTNVSPATKKMLVTKYFDQGNVAVKADKTSAIDQLLKITKKLQNTAFTSPQLKPAI